MRRTIILAVIFFALTMVTWQCTKQNLENGSITNSSASLKTALISSANNLNAAVAHIAETKGYQLLSVSNSSSVQSAKIANSGFTDSITLASIAGIYSYQPVSYNNWCYSCYSRLFTKTGTSNELIVQLPSIKVFYPRRFETVVLADTALPNNFVITASNFHYYFSNGLLYDYLLDASLMISDTAIGSLGIKSTSSSWSTYNYSSSYNFANGDSITVSVASGDTASSTVTLSNGTGTLLKETVLDIMTGGPRYFERQYLLTVGNVEFTRTSGSDSITVYVGGVLQTTAKVQIIDNSSTVGFNSLIVGRNRDLQVTFDDGTTTKLSTLLSPSVTVLQNVASSLQNLYFSTNIVDYIAFSIYNNKMN